MRLFVLFFLLFGASCASCAFADKESVISPNKKLIACVKTGDRVIPDGCDDFADTGSKSGNQIWIHDAEKNKERLLVDNNFECNSPEKQIVDPSDLKFSSDSKTLYFVSSAWVTSGALHAVQVDGKGLRYIIPASSVEVISQGEYKDDLIVQQHRYFIGGGSYDWLWLFTPEGKEMGPLGDEISQDQRMVIES